MSVNQTSVAALLSGKNQESSLNISDRILDNICEKYINSNSNLTEVKNFLQGFAVLAKKSKEVTLQDLAKLFAKIRPLTKTVLVDSANKALPSDTHKQKVATDELRQKLIIDALVEVLTLEETDKIIGWISNFEYEQMAKDPQNNFAGFLRNAPLLSLLQNREVQLDKDSEIFFKESIKPFFDKIISEILVDYEKHIESLEREKNKGAPKKEMTTYSPLPNLQDKFIEIFSGYLKVFTSGDTKIPIAIKKQMHILYRLFSQSSIKTQAQIPAFLAGSFFLRFTAGYIDRCLKKISLIYSIEINAVLQKYINLILRTSIQKQTNSFAQVAVEAVKLPDDKGGAVVNNNNGGEKVVAIPPKSDEKFFLENNLIQALDKEGGGAKEALKNFLLFHAKDVREEAWQSENTLPLSGDRTVLEIYSKPLSKVQPQIASEKLSTPQLLEEIKAIINFEKIVDNLMTLIEKKQNADLLRAIFHLEKENLGKLVSYLTHSDTSGMTAVTKAVESGEPLVLSTVLNSMYDYKDDFSDQVIAALSYAITTQNIPVIEYLVKDYFPGKELGLGESECSLICKLVDEHIGKDKKEEIKKSIKALRSEKSSMLRKANSFILDRLPKSDSLGKKMTLGLFGRVTSVDEKRGSTNTETPNSKFRQSVQSGDGMLGQKLRSRSTEVAPPLDLVQQGRIAQFSMDEISIQTTDSLEPKLHGNFELFSQNQIMYKHETISNVYQIETAVKNAIQKSSDTITEEDILALIKLCYKGKEKFNSDVDVLMKPLAKKGSEMFSAKNLSEADLAKAALLNPKAAIDFLKTNKKHEKFSDYFTAVNNMLKKLDDLESQHKTDNGYVQQLNKINQATSRIQIPGNKKN